MAQVIPLSRAKAPQEFSEVLTLRGARERFGLDHRQIYAWVEEGKLHAIQPGGEGRVWYPEWELHALVQSMGSDSTHHSHGRESVA